jgi:hypothetical protein
MVKSKDVRRYMTFSRFVWLLQNKKLWLARVDQFEDQWELALAGEQLEHTLSRHPIPKFPLREVPEGGFERARRIESLWRRTTFVNCWNASNHESHALWRIYCGASEGVLIETTFDRLGESTPGLKLLPIEYGTLGSRRITPMLLDLVTKKRPMFEYECEVRLIKWETDSPGEHASEDGVLGREFDWDPEANVDSIRVHPQADQSFMDTVSGVVAKYAPGLKDRVVWSEMRGPPPLSTKR